MAVNSNPPIELDPSMDTGHQLAFINQNFKSLSDSLNPYQLSDGSNNRLLIGKDSTGSYAIKISAAGYNAFDAANPNLIFNSGQDVFKIVQTGTITLTKAASTASAISTTPHGLGYQPAILAYTQNQLGTAYVPLQFYFINLSSGLVDYSYQISVDNTNINLFFAAPNYGTNTYYTATWTIVVKYYLLQESAA